MSRETEITLAAAGAIGAKYDRACKALFQNREILAPILKSVVPEYKDCTVREIIGYILTDSISCDPVDSTSAMAARLPNEMNSVSDKLIIYDAHFKAINPKLTTEIITFYLHFDVEVQNDYRPSNPKYPIVTRGIYYAAREIDSQLGVLTESTDYSALEKVYSIWICNENIPADLLNTVTSYSITKKDIIGVTNEPEEDYDLMTVVIIRRGNNQGTEDIFDYLTGLFTSNVKKVAEYTPIEENANALKGVNELSGLGMSIARDNLYKGIDIGRTEGELKRARENAKKMLQKGLGIDTATECSGLSIEEVQALAATL